LLYLTATYLIVYSLRIHPPFFPISGAAYSHIKTRYKVEQMGKLTNAMHTANIIPNINQYLSINFAAFLYFGDSRNLLQVEELLTNQHVARKVSLL
jgi:hypothetical protein